MSSEAIARRLIERHRLEAHTVGEAQRLVALTHNLEPDFFDDDLLPNVFGLSRADDRSYAANIELQRKLQGMTCRVLMAKSAYRGRPSLRTEVRPVSLRTGVLHAKCFVVEYERAVLVSLGSANLTSNGFRKNREVAGVMLTRQDDPQDAAALVETLTGAIGALRRFDHAWMQPVVEDLEAVRARVTSWHSSLPPSPHRIVWSDTEQRLIDVLVNAWSAPSRVRRIDIVSPFWSEDGQNLSPLRTWLERLRSAGKLADRVAVHLHFDAHALEGGGYKPAYPSRFQVHYDDLGGVEVFAHAVDPSVDKSELDIQVELNAARPLHAKLILLEGGRQALAYAGSANFTRAGLGIGQSANIEAGWLLSGPARELQALIPPAVDTLERIGSGAIAPQLPEPDEEAELYVPDFLLDVTLTPDPEHPERLQLDVAWSKGAPARFELLTVAFDDTRGIPRGDTVLFSGGGGAGRASIALEAAALRNLLQAREVWVKNLDKDQEGSYPVNVSGDARLSLPIAPGAASPGEAALLAYYQGQITFEELFPDPGQDPTGQQQGRDALERSGVDTTQIQSYRIRAFVEALPGMLAELIRVCGPRPLLEVAFLSDTSPVGLARCIAAEARSGRKSPVAAGFQLVEILRVLREAGRHVANRDPELLGEVVAKAEQKVTTLLEEVRHREPHAFGQGAPFTRYQHAILGGTRP